MIIHGNNDSTKVLSELASCCLVRYVISLMNDGAVSHDSVCYGVPVKFPCTLGQLMRRYVADDHHQFRIERETATLDFHGVRTV